MPNKYIEYFKEHHAMVKKENPNLKPSEVMKLVAGMYREQNGLTQKPPRPKKGGRKIKETKEDIENSFLPQE